MARHRKTPVPRHRARGRDVSLASSEASERRFGAVMRRVVVTPTFAAGLGVVVAAVLAYPMQTVFSYVVPGASGQGGLVCTQAGCTNHSGQGKPYPFGVGDGVFPSSPRSTEPGNDAPQHVGGGGATAQPRLTYKVTGRWQGGFWGRITIVPGPAAAPMAAADRLSGPPHPAHQAERPPRARRAWRARAVDRLLRRLGTGRSHVHGRPQGPRQACPPGELLVQRPTLPLQLTAQRETASGSAGDLARLDARGAHVQAARRAVHLGPHGLDVGVEAARSAVMRVRDPVTESRPLAADVADGSHAERSLMRSRKETPPGRRPGQC